jgi:hypothetical protein
MEKYLKHTLYCGWKDGRYVRSLGCTCGFEKFKMSITDPILLAYSQRWRYYLIRGRETFYDKDRALVTFNTPEEAIAWSEKHLGQTPIEVQSEKEREKILEGAWKKKKQLKLL